MLTWGDGSPKARSRMRAHASLTMLHLARADIYSSIVMQNFVKLALTIQVRKCCTPNEDAEICAGYMLRCTLNLPQ